MNPSLFLLDTNTISAAIRDKNGVREKIRSVHHDRFRVPSIVLAELEYGSLKAPDPDSYRLRWRRFLHGIPVVPFDEPSAIHHAKIRLELRHQPIGDRDLVIAAMALAYGLTVVSSNTGEFRRVQGLRVEDWSIAKNV
jgi:tRNA(fMet)-specific endonuclease VapC